ncbi:MAG: hypothetical protein HJJLKODD_02228 [Phycisphaerae bacterium]|nr:hypothetical protein [Phycisphaerae bacterium]
MSPSSFKSTLLEPPSTDENWIMSADHINTPSGIRSVQENGVALIRGFFTADDLQPINEDITKLASAFYQALGQSLPVHPPHQLDRLLVTLLQQRPDWQSTLYDRLQQLPSLLALPNHARFQKLSRTMLQSQSIGVWPRVQMRLDRYADDKNVIEWHHDYLYNQGTRASYTLWMPLVNISAEMGLLQIAPGSHRLTEVPFTKTEHERRFDYTLTDEFLANLSVTIPDQYQAGDLLIFHSLVLHSGASNRHPERARLVALFRVQDLNQLDLFSQ